MTEWNVTTVRDLLVEAGRIALHHFDTPGTEHKRDASLVTIADRAVEDFLTAELAPGADGALLIGEESVGGTTQDEVDAALAGQTWVVDPIDGTAPYANRLSTWGVSIGLMEKGRLSHGALFLPPTGEIFLTSGDDVLYEEATADPASWIFDDLTPLPLVEQPYASTGMLSLPNEIGKRARFNGRNPIQVLGSAVFAVAKLVQGNYIGMVTGLKLWDLAGAAPILRRMGYAIQFPDRRELGELVTGRDWITDAASLSLWKCRGNLFIAQSPETLEYLHTHYHIEK